MQFFKYPDRNLWPELLQRPVMDSSKIEEEVEIILLDIKKDGDAALSRHARRLGEEIHGNFLVSGSELKAASKLLDEPLKNSIQHAIRNIKRFHKLQMKAESPVEIETGVTCWRKSVPIECVGLYIPGGTAPLFSTVLMLGIPALLAGCREIILCSPPSKNGTIHPAILYAAQKVGIKKVFKVGGPMAIAAMAFGTESIPKTLKIFGPGNQYVTTAKQLVQRAGVAIDMPAGPSELLVWADESSVSAYVAADLLSQAEHGPDSQVILVTTHSATIENVFLELENQIKKLPRKDIAWKALKNSKAFLVRKPEDAIDLINSYAPEHLILSCLNYESVANKIVNAGSVFLGNYTPESAGDYASGTNHTLPTHGYAKTLSGISCESFVKKITFQHISKEGIASLGNTIEIMAEAEGLTGHKNAVTIRRINHAEKI